MPDDLSTSSAAPGDLEFVRRFVNTLDIEAGTDELGSPPVTAAWLRREGMSVRIDRGGFDALIELREAIRDVVSARGGREADRAAAVVDAIARRHPVVVRMSSAETLGALSRGGADAVIERILSVVATARIDGTWSRMKTCANVGCRWLYFDHSRNRSRTWCTMDLCGSQAKMRAYRRRARSAAATTRPLG
jgi:predicted RNA-binding Zn ribbon-like protein